ncbi:MAG: FkbM family methyltransferase [Candidatus Tectimicrobiota bacterium]
MHASLVQDDIVRGEQLFQQGQPHEALRLFAAALTQEPDNVQALNNQGVVQHHLGLDEAAEQSFLAVLRQTTPYARAIVNLVTHYLSQYRIAEAQTILRRYGDALSSQDVDDIQALLQHLQAPRTPATASLQHLTVRMEVRAQMHIFHLNLDCTSPGQQAIAAASQQQALYHPGLIHFLATALQAQDSFIDIGAYIGYVTLAGASLVGPQGQVYAWEPEEHNYRALLQNRALNQAAQVTVLTEALGSQDKKARLYINLDNDAGHTLWNVGCHPQHVQSRLRCVTRDVHLTTLDQALAAHTLRRLKLLHIDTGGAEFDIIQGAAGTILEQRVPYILCAINRFGLQQMGTSEQELRQFLGYMGYDTYWLQIAEPRLLPLLPEQSIDTDHELHLLFANPEYSATSTTLQHG